MIPLARPAPAAWQAWVDLNLPSSCTGQHLPRYLHGPAPGPPPAARTLDFAPS